MKQKRIVSLLVSLVTLITILPGNVVFAAKAATNSTYGITIETSDYIICGKCNTGNGDSHPIKSIGISQSGQVSNGKVTLNITVNMNYNKEGHPTSAVIPYTVDISCDNTINLSKQKLSGSDGYQLTGCTITKAKQSHSWSNGTCTRCKKTCSHTSYANGKCTTCQIPHSGHTWSSSTGKCTVCGLDCSHSWSDGKCTTCGLGCTHTWSSTTGKCTVCGIACGHTWSSSTGKCTTCGITCGHTWSSSAGKCTVCGVGCSHIWSSSAGKCTVCGVGCNHTYKEGICATCGINCAHPNMNGICPDCCFTDLDYIDRTWNNETKALEVTTKHRTGYDNRITGYSSSRTLSDGWYIISGNVNTGKITISGTVNLILCDGASLSSNGIILNEGNTLNIYAQSDDLSTMGSIYIQGFVSDGIGYYPNNSGTLNINGGKVTAIGSANRPGINVKGSGGGLTINGGFVTATGGNAGAGIGGGWEKYAKDETDNVTVNGGTVIDKAGSGSAAAIGGGWDGEGRDVVINGGNVQAISTGRLIGRGSGGSYMGTLKNSSGNDVSLKTYTLEGVDEQTKITSTEGCSGANFYTLDANKLYIYLPSDGNITKVTLEDGRVLAPYRAGDRTLHCAHVNKRIGYCTDCGAYLKKAETETMVQDKNGAYLILNLDDLMWFVDHVNSGNSNADAVLYKDINASVAPNCKIGTSDRPYTGTFNGNGNTLTLALSGSDYSALFPYVNGATIKNLNTKGTITVSSRFASGLVGYSSGNTTLENCMSFIAINSSVSGDATHGGLVANAAGGSLTVNNCAFMGAIDGENTQNCGGLVGWAATETKISNSYVAADFDIDESGSSNTIARNPGKVKMSNCYYTYALGYDGTNAEYISDEQVKSGELAYMLNGSVSGGDRWYQNIDNGKTDEYPVPYKFDYPYYNNRYSPVYYGYADCSAENAKFTNTYTKKSIRGHNGGVENCLSAGICVDCGAEYIPLDKDKHATDETYYALIDENTHGLYHSCCNELIESGAHDNDAENTCKGIAHCKICDISYGEIDSGNHTGKLICRDTSNGTHEYRYDCCGLVTKTANHELTCTADGDTVTVVCNKCDGNGKYPSCQGNGTVTISVNGKQYDGKAVEASYKATGFMQYWSRPAKITFEYCCEGGCKTAGDHTVKMCVGDAEVTKEFTITKKPLAVTKVRAFGKAYDMTNDVFVNAVDLDGIVVYKEADSSSPLEIKDNVEIDLSEVVVTVADSLPGSYGTANVKNIVLTGSDKDNYSIAETAENVEIKDGSDDYKIWKIQISVTPNDQTLYGDDAKIDQTAYAVDGLDDIYALSGEFLYEENGKIKVNTEKIKITYGNEDVTENFDISAYYIGNVVRYCANHTFNENGFCATGECDSFEAATLITKENCSNYGFKEYEINDYSPKYAICNAGQLYWFADRVNNYNESEISGVLAADITVNEDLTAKNLREWSPIGKDSMLPYCGNFYGNGHTVSGLYCKNEDGGAGFFGSLNYPAVSDLHIARSYFEGNNSGGIAGYSGGATLNMCSVGDDVTVKGVFSGGLLGSDGGYGTIENCFALADVSGNTAGGLVGQNTATIRNCFTNAMQPVGHGGSFENVYYAEDTRDYETPDENGYLPVKPDFEGTNEVKSFADGEIAYLLQSGIKGEIIDYDEENDWEPNLRRSSSDLGAENRYGQISGVEQRKGIRGRIQRRKIIPQRN